MTLSYHPAPGAILVCDYDTGFREPEMVKRRLCVVITPRLRRRDGLCTVVPLSTTAPDEPQDYHCELQFARPLPKPWPGDRKWAKCDMLATVGYARLSPIGIGRDAQGKRRYIYPHLAADQLKDIRRAVLCALSLRELTIYL
jgi:mRNA interferase MazF